jgi:hypothetical protein
LLQSRQRNKDVREELQRANRKLFGMTDIFTILGVVMVSRVYICPNLSNCTFLNVCTLHVNYASIKSLLAKAILTADSWYLA